MENFMQTVFLSFCKLQLVVFICTAASNFYLSFPLFYLLTGDGVTYMLTALTTVLCTSKLGSFNDKVLDILWKVFS